MNYNDKKAENIKIAYIGGGSKGWAWILMNDLANATDISGDVHLYDIDFEAAKSNQIIGNKFNNVKGTKTTWNYHADENIGDALENADFVIISILPGTLDEMASDVHTPEKYGIYQSVGDTTGPGGIIRAMRTIPMYEHIGKCIKKYCPNAWVISYTNPMTLCIKTLYRVFPEIKAFGCCHEVFGTQRLLTQIVQEYFGVKPVRSEIKVNPIAVNHFTWLTSAKWKNIDLFPYYNKFIEKHPDGLGLEEELWLKDTFACGQKVKFDLFKRFGYIAAAGDRHLAEFCEGKWYLESPERVTQMHFGLTTVDRRKQDLAKRIEKSVRLINGEEKIELRETGEEGVNQIRALLGLNQLVTNVNIPNYGQIPNLPIGAVVETNAIFDGDRLTPVFAGNVPIEIFPLVSRICAEQEALSDAVAQRDIEKIFSVFINDPLVTCSPTKARELFDEMCQNTKDYLSDYTF